MVTASIQKRYIESKISISKMSNFHSYCEKIIYNK